MKLKFLAALATALIAGTPAMAENWRAYQVGGTGTLTPMAPPGQAIAPSIDTVFVGTFSVYLGPSPGTSPAYGNGFGFTYGYPGFYDEYEHADATTSGRLALTYHSYTPSGGTSGSLSISYDDGDTIGGFPLQLASDRASGTLEYSSGYNNYGASIRGTVTNFLDLGPTSGFQPFSVSSVPEPATWATMIAGFALAGAGLRRRGRRTAQVA